MTLGIVRLLAGLAAVKLGSVLLSVVCWALTTERRLDAFGVSACEQCWMEARGNPKLYAELIKLSPCPPEAQAGPNAKVCPTCQRRTLHQYTDECMAGCKP